MSLEMFPCVDYKLLECSVMVKTLFIIMKHFPSIVTSTPSARLIFYFIVGFYSCTCDNAKGLLSSTG